MLPNFVVIGAPRCGTTWLHYNLRTHPDVFVPKEKELHFFDNRYEEGIESYAAAFHGCSGQRAVGDITPAYLSGAYSSNRAIPETMHRHIPDARLIAILRNPVDRAYSHYCFNLARDARNLGLSFEQKIAQRPQILEEGLYADHLERYVQLFGTDRLLVLLYEDIEPDPLSLLRRIYSFLEVDPDFVSGLEDVKRNAAVGQGNLARSRLLWGGGRVLAKLGMVRASERLRRVNGVSQPEPMTAATRRRLIEHYRSSNSRLAEMISRDLSSWDAC